MNIRPTRMADLPAFLAMADDAVGDTAPYIPAAAEPETYARF